MVFILFLVDVFLKCSCFLGIGYMENTSVCAIRHYTMGNTSSCLVFIFLRQVLGLVEFSYHVIHLFADFHLLSNVIYT